MNKNEIQLMKKGELHVHLNGLVSTDVIRSLLVTKKQKIEAKVKQRDRHILNQNK
ncbi:hypothetical protein [Amphritea pacifica]|uniref:hypothetical protein n=1 Tax=Amphritea pacifica TaxID=2811233 RepID=UPI001962ED8A|nr:hypothetical protein [Amphritea pacifica]MBN1009210.1 hypothetical protein [Amphritea pacifica]